MTEFSPIAVLLAAILAFAFGFVWHRLFERRWMTASGYGAKPAMKPGPLAIVFFAELVMAAMLAGLGSHMGATTVYDMLVTAILIWAGFTLATMVVDHSYEARSRKLTYINGAHWLGVFLIMGIVIGLSGNGL